LKGDDIEIAITHNNDYGEDIYSFVNGQHTTQGGTHQQAFREAYVKTIRDFYKKDYDAADVRTGIVAAVAVRVVEPVFESQTKTKLGSVNVDEGGPSMRQFVGDFCQKSSTITCTKTHPWLMRSRKELNRVKGKGRNWPA
jgi:topoisomerase-4 subunit B